MLRDLDEEGAELVRRFRRDEPWDSDHNAKLIPLMPRAYEIPGRPAPPGHTFYKVLVAAPGYQDGRYVPMWGVRSSPRLNKISDGTNDTIMIVECHEPVIWTKPEDIVIDAALEDLEQPLGFSLGAGDKERYFLACCGSCEVRAVRTSLPDPARFKELLRSVIGYRDGERANWEELQP